MACGDGDGDGNADFVNNNKERNYAGLDPSLDPKLVQKQKQAQHLDTQDEREIKQTVKRMRPKPRTMGLGDRDARKGRARSRRASATTWRYLVATHSFDFCQGQQEEQCI